MFWDIVWEGPHEVFIKSKLFLLSTVSLATIHIFPLYVTLSPGLINITTTQAVLYIMLYMLNILLICVKTMLLTEMEKHNKIIHV